MWAPTRPTGRRSSMIFFLSPRGGEPTCDFCWQDRFILLIGVGREMCVVASTSRPLSTLLCTHRPALPSTSHARRWPPPATAHQDGSLKPRRVELLFLP